MCPKRRSFDTRIKELPITKCRLAKAVGQVRRRNHHRDVKMGYLQYREQKCTYLQSRSQQKKRIEEESSSVFSLCLAALNHYWYSKNTFLHCLFRIALLSGFVVMYRCSIRLAAKHLTVKWADWYLLTDDYLIKQKIIKRPRTLPVPVTIACTSQVAYARFTTARVLVFAEMRMREITESRFFSFC